MLLYRLSYFDSEYGYDIYEGLFRTKESMFDHLKKIVLEYDRDASLEDKDIIESKRKENNLSNTLFNISYYVDEKYLVEDFGYEIIDTDNLV